MLHWWLEKVRFFLAAGVYCGPFVSSKDGIWDFLSKNVWCKCARWRVYPACSFGHIQKDRGLSESGSHPSKPRIKLTNSPEEGVRWLTQSMWVLGRCMKNGPYPSMISGYHSDTTWYHYSQPSYSIGIYVYIYLDIYYRERESERVKLFSIIISENMPQRKINHLTAPTKSQQKTVRVIPYTSSPSASHTASQWWYPPNSRLWNAKVCEFHLEISVKGDDVDVSKNGGFPEQPWVVLLKMIIFEVFWGYPYFWKHPCVFPVFHVKSCGKKWFLAKLVPSKVDCRNLGLGKLLHFKAPHLLRVWFSIPKN